MTKASPLVDGVVLWRWTYAREQNGDIIEGSGCQYCDVARVKSEQFGSLTPKQCQKFINRVDEEGVAARERFQPLQVAVINILVSGSKVVTQAMLKHNIEAYQVNEEELVKAMKFLSLDLYQKWKARNPRIAHLYTKVESKSDPMTNQVVLGIRVPKEEDGSYDLNVISRTGVHRRQEVDDGSVQLGADYMEKKFEQSRRELFAGRGAFDHSI